MSRPVLPPVQTSAPPDRAPLARLEHVLAWLDAQAEARPTLAATAAVAGWSPAHCQRQFTAHVGLSPQRYLQATTAERARQWLAQSRPVLDTALELGLSGPGRLHDVLLTTTGVTPGDVGRGGAGLTLHWAFHPTPFGEAFIAVAPRGVCALTFAPDGDRASRLARLVADWPAADLVEDPGPSQAVAAALGELGRLAVTGVAPMLPFPLLVRGTNLQVRVWEALRRIPPGMVTSYQQVARAVGLPHGAQAVGQAIGRNPVQVLIPCHRVLRVTGDLGGYAGGLQRKRALLAHEATLAPGARMR